MPWGRPCCTVRSVSGRDEKNLYDCLLYTSALGGTVDSADYGADIRLTVSLPAENTAVLRERLTELSAGGIVLTVTAEAYRPGPKVEI